MAAAHVSWKRAVKGVLSEERPRPVKRASGLKLDQETKNGIIKSSIKPESAGKRGWDRIRYDNTKRGWQGAATKVMALTAVSKRRQSKIQQDIDGRQKDVKVNKSNIHVNVDLEQEPDVVSISEQPIEEVPIIRRPFSSKTRGPSDRKANWKTPNFPKQDRCSSFKWEKPLNSEESTSYSSPGQQLNRLQGLLHEKDKELEIIRNQLKKTQTDNYNLIKELQGYKGEHYDDLKKENVILKEQIERVIRENMKLCGLRRQDQNTKLHELKLKEELQRKHGVRNRNSATPRKSDMAEETSNGLNDGDVSLLLSSSDGGQTRENSADNRPKVAFDA